MSEIINAKKLIDKYGSVEAGLEAIALRSQSGFNEKLDQAEKPRKKYVYLEVELQKQIAGYLEFKYPNIVFESSATNLNLTQRQGKRLKDINSNNDSVPDMKIHAARKGFHGLHLELKIETVYKKNGEFKKNEHIQKQWATIQKLRSENYHADFYWTFNQAKKVIDWYLR